MGVVNTQAYYDTTTITAAKGFMKQPLDIVRNGHYF
jgi:hypothetical protein